MDWEIDDPKAESLAKEIATRTGESVEDVVLKALEERLARLQAKEPMPDPCQRK